MKTVSITMVKYAVLLAAAALLLSLAAQPAQGQTLQRLFSTPAMRAELDRRRARLAQGQPAVEIASSVPAQPILPVEQVDIIYQLGGVVSRSDGNYTVWLNNRPFPQNGLPQNMELLAPYGQGRLRIHDPETGARYEIVPGQVLNLATGNIQESYLRSNIALVAEPAAVPDDLPADVEDEVDDNDQNAPAPEQDQANPQ